MISGEATPRVDFNLYVITDRKQTRERPLEFVVEEALHGGVRAVQLREKDLSSKALYELAYELRRLTSRYNAKLFINDRCDIAVAVDADGVQIGADSLPIYKVRKLLGAQKLIGVSCHNQVQAIAAQEMGADFVTFGPVYHTPSKASFGEPVGVDKLAEVAQLLRIPVFALGGVKKELCREALQAGAHGVAMISAVLSSEDPRKASRELRALLSQPENHD